MSNAQKTSPAVVVSQLVTMASKCIHEVLRRFGDGSTSGDMMIADEHGRSYVTLRLGSGPGPEVVVIGGTNDMLIAVIENAGLLARAPSDVVSLGQIALDGEDSNLGAVRVPGFILSMMAAEDGDVDEAFLFSIARLAGLVSEAEFNSAAELSCNEFFDRVYRVAEVAHRMAA